MPPPGMKSQVFAALPGDILQLVAKTGLVESTIRRHLHALRKDGQCHISSWRRKNGGPTPRYAVGPGVDAKKPKALSNASYSRKFRKLKREERADFDAARQTAREHAARAARTPQTWASALMMSA